MYAILGQRVTIAVIIRTYPDGFVLFLQNRILTFGVIDREWNSFLQSSSHITATAWLFLLPLSSITYSLLVAMTLA